MLVTGSIERIFTNGDGEVESRALEVYDFDPEYAAMYLGWTFNLRDIVAVDPPRDGAVGEWTARDDKLRDVAVVLWPEPVFDPAILEGGA